MLKIIVIKIIEIIKIISKMVDYFFSINSLMLRTLFPIIILIIEKLNEDGINVKSTL